MGSSSTRRSGQWLPLGYGALALAIAALLLPTALRPPPDQQNATASFSPDAPPDENPPELVLQSIRQASSSTAGATAVAITEEEVEVAAPPPPPPPPRRAARGRCFGDPPRVTESLYSPLCVPAFTGESNGGATWRGVTENEIFLGVTVGLSSSVPEGPLSSDFSPTDTDSTYQLKVWQAFFNSKFEFYNRTLRFVIIKQSGTDEDQQRSSVTTADEVYNVFAMYGNGAAGAEEAIRRKIIELGTFNGPVDYYGDNHPYAYAFYMDSWQHRHLAVELVCKQFAGKPPGLLNEREDPLFDYNAPRKWGVISYQDETRGGASDMYRTLLRQCGIEELETQEYNLTDNQQSIAGSVSKMRAAGVTTIILAVDGVTPAVLSNEAQKANYFPEWIHAGTGGIDLPAAGRLMDDNQAEHIVGISALEIPRENPEKDWYRAFKEIDPNGDPDGDYTAMYRTLLQFSGAIQHAGPTLNPETLWAGFKKTPYRAPDPQWSMGGGYREKDQFMNIGRGKYGDYTYIDFVALQWFDNKADDPNSSLTGSWRYPYGGKRFTHGEIPTEPIPWFKDGINTPEKGQQG